MLTIALTDKAQSDLHAIHEHYQSHSGLDAADAVIAVIFNALEQLRTFSGLGRPSQTPEVRELVFTRYPLLAPYRVKNNQIQILRVVHQRTERSAFW